MQNEYLYIRTANNKISMMEGCLNFKKLNNDKRINIIKDKVKELYECIDEALLGYKKDFEEL